MTHTTWSIRKALAGYWTDDNMNVVNRFPALTAIEIVRTLREGRSIPYAEHWAVWAFTRATTKAQRIVSWHLYALLNGDPIALDRVVVRVLEHRGWGRSLRRGVSRFVQRMPRAVREAEQDTVFGEFTLRELESLAHVPGRGKW